ncbi:hypothetical protein Bbelb_188600 [Branchiostoma belcheri]|nr:hypothetical protein Bbelb_188600 [Branchiostoma belcheri]
MERMSRLCVAVMVLVFLKFSLPCPEECFEWEKNSRNNCQCPRQHVEITMKCYTSRGQAVAANSVCSAENHGLTCLNGVPTGFNQSVIGIHLNNLFNLTTLTKHDIPPLRSLIRVVIIGSTIQAIEAGAFSSVPAIQWITIKCSRLQHIGDEAIANLSKLMGIFLYYNLIETVSPRAFVHLNSLTTMILSLNQLKEGPFEALSLIRNSTTGDGVDVNLNNNRIATILEANWKKIVDKLLSIDLKGNPLVCDGRIRWLVCNTTKLNHGVLSQAGLLKCTSPPELAGYDFKSLHTNSFCSSTEPTTKSLMTSTSAFPNAMTSQKADPTNFPTENIRKTTSACTEQAKKTTSGTMDSTRSITLEKNLDDGQQSRTDYIYMPIALTVGVIVLLGGTAVAVIMYKRHVSKGRQNPVHGQQGVIISSQLISNRMYQHSGSATGDDRDKEETDETEEGSARQNPVNKRHKVIIDTSLLISNQMYTSSASSANSANEDTLMTEETEEDLASRIPANQDTETIEGPEENSELTSYLTVPLDAINNTLRIEPYSSVDLDDISSNEEMNDDLQLAPSPEHQDEDDMEPYSITPLDQIDNP